ncbi:MAG TPA: hypothetical protein PK736_06900, partial [Bacteroidia bacterium]|nr:hypothetical protein [Bacteroidia bacterium]
MVGTEPEEGVKDKELANPLPDVNDTSKPVGGVTNKFAVRPVPETVNDCSAETLPWHDTNGINTPVVVILAPPIAE